MKGPNHLLTCITCDKFVPNDQSHPQNGGGCRALPPVPMVMGVLQDKITQQMRPNLQTAWPGVGAKGDWCALHPLYVPPTKILSGRPAGPTEEIKPALVVGADERKLQ